MFGLLGREAGARKHQPRPPRNAMSCSATIVADNRFYRASLLNVSHGGCRARVVGQFRPGQNVQIALEAFHSLSGTVRWTKDDELGIQFTRPISSPVLGKWQKELAKGGDPTPLVPARRGLRDFWGDLRRPFV
jgi:hypothetical protein